MTKTETITRRAALSGLLMLPASAATAAALPREPETVEEAFACFCAALERLAPGREGWFGTMGRNGDEEPYLYVSRYVGEHGYRKLEPMPVGEYA